MNYFEKFATRKKEIYFIRFALGMPLIIYRTFFLLIVSPSRSFDAGTTQLQVAADRIDRSHLSDGKGSMK